MEFYNKLPRNKKEFILFMAIVSIISVNIIGPIISCFQTGFSVESWINTLHILPFIWLSVIVLVLLTKKPAEYMKNRIVKREDSFNAHIIVNILCNVFMMSIVLTIVGEWIGSGQITMHPIENFIYNWPRNFAVAFAVELLIAQPIARFAMVKLHQAIDSKVQIENANA